MKKRIWLVGVLIFLNGALSAAAQETAKDYYERAGEKMIQHDYDGAVADYSKAIEADPNYLDAYANRAIAKSAKGDPGGALEDFSKAEKIDPNSFIVLYARAGMRFEQKDYDGAIADFSKVVSLYPTSAQAQHGLAAARVYKGEFDKAIDGFTKAIELTQNPRLKGAIFRDRGTAKNKKGDDNGAIADWEKAIELNPACKDDLDPKIQNARGNLKR